MTVHSWASRTFEIVMQLIYQRFLAFCTKLQAEPEVTPFNLKALFTSLVDLYSILQLNLKDHHTHQSVNYQEVYYLGALHIVLEKHLAMA